MEEMQEAADEFVRKIGVREAEQLNKNLEYTRNASNGIHCLKVALLKATRFSGVRYYGTLKGTQKESRKT